MSDHNVVFMLSIDLSDQVLDAVPTFETFSGFLGQNKFAVFVYRCYASGVITTGLHDENAISHHFPSLVVFTQVSNNATTFCIGFLLGQKHSTSRCSCQQPQ